MDMVKHSKSADRKRKTERAAATRSRNGIARTDETGYDFTQVTIVKMGYLCGERLKRMH